MTRPHLAWLATAAMVVAAGCGGGSGSSTPVVRTYVAPATCDRSRFVPNYVPEPVALGHWNHFPIRIAFLHDALYAPQWEAIVRRGIQQWTDATGGFLAWVAIDDPKSADVQVQFATDDLFKTFYPTYNPAGQEKLWATNFPTKDLDGTIRFVHVYVNTTWPQVPPESLPYVVQAAAAHEFGHVFGIPIHGPDCGDLMSGNCNYALPTSPFPVTQRDLNSMKTAYCAAFGG